MANGTAKALWTIDTGTDYCGLAHWADGRLLNACYVDPGRGYANYNRLNRIGVCLSGRLLLQSPTPTEVIIEMPVNYDTAHQKGDQRDIRNLAASAGAIGGAIGAVTMIPVYYVEPSAWKGQVPKEVMLQRIWGHLSEEEQRNVECTVSQLDRAFSHGDGSGADTLDAVGLGLFRLQRLNKKKIRTDTFTLEGVG